MPTDDEINAVFDAMASEDPYQQGPGLDQTTGGTLLDRVATAFKFDEQGVENYLKETYGKENAFRGKDGNLYFLPPDQLALEPNDRTLVRFNPEGLDIGDVVSFVPAALGAIGGIAAAWLSGGTSIPLTLGALATGGAAGEAVVQGVGAALPGEEPTATPGARLGRIATSAALEAGAGAVGEAARVVGPALVQGVREGSRRSFQHALRYGVSPETIEATEQLGRRVGIKFTEGQLTRSQAALLAERFVRQNIVSANEVARADMASVDALGKYATKMINNLGKEPFEVGVRKAVNAHTMHLEKLAERRDELVKPMFARARSAFGDDRVVPLDKTISRLQKLADSMRADAPGDDAREAVQFIAERIASIPGGKTSISSLQNMLSDWGKLSVDPRGVSQKILDPKLKKSIARTFFGGLKDDLSAAIDNPASVISEGATGQFRSGRGVNEALQELSKARTIYREMSQAIEAVADNPIAEYADNPERLAKLFLGQSSDPTSAKQIMGFLDEVAPAEADELRSSVMQQLIRQASGGNTNEPIRPALLRNIADKASVQLDALFAGKPKAKSALNDMVESARLLGDYGRLQGAQTEPLLVIEKLFRAVGAGLGLSLIRDDDVLSEGQKELAGLAAMILGPRWVARSMTHPPAAKAYSKIFTAATKPKLSDGAKKAVRQAVIDIVNYNRRAELTGREQRGHRDLARRVMDFAPGGL